ncbi:MAG: SigF/SigG family RNA polymerase sporulation sigma factor [Lachnospiraceae bacterium]|nr:SigF/SigG family RNA polymerase sporulation sigma factor [Lachnospiraceae bacterium]
MEEVAVLIARAQQGDKEAREVLIEKNLGLVHAIARRFVGRGVEAEDLFQIGTIGLIKAIDHFDLSYEVKFSTYAVPLISGEIKRFLRDDGPLKVSRTLKEQAMKINLVRQRLQGKWGREPTLQEIAAEAMLSVEEIVAATEADYQVESIYASVYGNDGSEMILADMLGKEDEEKEALLNRMLLNQLLEQLDEKESELIRLRYFQDKTQTEVARLFGISQVQVSRMEKKILLNMRTKAQGKVC